MAGRATPTAHAISGAVGSAVALLLTYPLERARLELQSSAGRSGRTRRRPLPASAPPSSGQEEDAGGGLGRCLADLRRRGELYRGAAPVATTLAVSNYVFFYALQAVKELLAAREEHDRSRGDGAAGSRGARSLLASALAGIINVLVTNPLWVANLRIVQRQRRGDGHDGSDGRVHASATHKDEPGLFAVMGRIGRDEGLPALWSGTLASLVLVANPVLQFFVYDRVRLVLLGRRQRRGRGGAPAVLSPLEAFALGAAAKALATVVTYPVQV